MCADKEPRIFQFTARGGEYEYRPGKVSWPHNLVLVLERDWAEELRDSLDRFLRTGRDTFVMGNVGKVVEILDEDTEETVEIPEQPH